MELIRTLQCLIAVVSFLGYSVNAYGYYPGQGEIVVVNSPVLGRAENIAYLYAIQTSGIDTDVVEFSKQGGLVSQTVKTGEIIDGDDKFGCYLSVGLPNSYRGTRYGTFTAQFISQDGYVITRYGFIKPKTSVLDTRGVYTRTVWPAVSGGTRLASSPDNDIGVRWSPGCRSIQWCKGKKRNVNTGPRLQLTSTDDAGVYTIRRGKRGARGWSVQIKVIAASCPMDSYRIGPDSCTSRTRNFPCANGGVVRDGNDLCTCPPFYSGSDCAEEVDKPVKPRDFVLAVADGSALRCGDLPGGNPKCRGYLFCFGDLYGCKCASGWWGNNCDRPCQKGKWGVDCSQRCPDSQRDCDRFFGPIREMPK